MESYNLFFQAIARFWLFFFLDFVVCRERGVVIGDDGNSTLHGYVHTPVLNKLEYLTNGEANNNPAQKEGQTHFSIFFLKTASGSNNLGRTVAVG